MAPIARWFARAVSCLIVGCLAGTTLTTVRAQQRPLLTEAAEVITPGSVRVEAGVDTLQCAKFPVSGLTGDLTRVGVGLDFGVADNVEVEIDVPMYNRLRIESASPPAISLELPSSEWTSDPGDVTVATKIRLRRERGGGPALGLRFGVDLPTSDEARGIGLNQTNPFAALLVEKTFGREGRFRVLGNLGAVLLSVPGVLFSQNDALTYAVAGIYRARPRLSIVGEIAGRENTRHDAPLGAESLSEARIGVRIQLSFAHVDVAAIHGLKPVSPLGGVTVGVTCDTPPLLRAGRVHEKLP